MRLQKLSQILRFCRHCGRFCDLWCNFAESSAFLPSLRDLTQSSRGNP
ncbi:hypothetical protein ACWIUD_03325 [Helicobacter sp. 23-1044]